MPPRDVGEFFAELPPATREVVLALRDVIQTVAPDAQESLLWGGLSYHRPWIGGRVKGAVCQIGVKGGTIYPDFIHGIRLPDPEGLLRGNQLSKRYVPVQSPDQARRPEIADLIRQAAAFVPK